MFDTDLCIWSKIERSRGVRSTAWPAACDVCMCCCFCCSFHSMLLLLLLSFHVALVALSYLAFVVIFMSCCCFMPSKNLTTVVECEGSAAAAGHLAFGAAACAPTLAH